VLYYENGKKGIEVKNRRKKIYSSSFLSMYHKA
jgi:hypothetical protein